jgi:hypothetical protein
MAVDKKRSVAPMRPNTVPPGRVPSEQPKPESAVFAISHETSRSFPTGRGHARVGPIRPHFIYRNTFPKAMLGNLNLDIRGF